MKDREESSSGSSMTATSNPNGIINGEHEPREDINGEHEHRELNIRSFSSVPSSPRNASSKYDFVKVCFFLSYCGVFDSSSLFEFLIFLVDDNFF